MVEWKRRLDDFAAKGWHNRASVRGTPQIEYVGLVNREDDTEDRAVVRITASLRAFVEDSAGRHTLQTGAKSENVGLCEYWTLARSDCRKTKGPDPCKARPFLSCGLPAQQPS
jgi:hypothetical protein